jgi:hypothetical protein
MGFCNTLSKSRYSGSVGTTVRDDTKVCMGQRLTVARVTRWGSEIAEKPPTLSYSDMMSPLSDDGVAQLTRFLVCRSYPAAKTEISTDRYA